MAKDPAFLFYPGDWLGGTMSLTREQKGAYMDLLILQFNCGKFTEAQAKEVLSICFEVAWPLLKQKFKVADGFHWNERLAIEIEKRKKFTESRRSNGSKEKKNSRKHEAYAYATDKRMEDENENTNEHTVKGIESKERGVGETIEGKGGYEVIMDEVRLTIDESVGIMDDRFNSPVEALPPFGIVPAGAPTIIEPLDEKLGQEGTLKRKIGIKELTYVPEPGFDPRVPDQAVELLADMRRLPDDLNLPVPVGRVSASGLRPIIILARLMDIDDIAKMSFRGYGFKLETFQAWVNAYVRFLQWGGEDEKTLRDFKTGFFYWLAKRERDADPNQYTPVPIGKQTPDKPNTNQTISKNGKTDRPTPSKPGDPGFNL